MPDVVPVDHDPFGDAPQLSGDFWGARSKLLSGDRISQGPELVNLDAMLDRIVGAVAQPGRDIGDWISQQRGPTPPGLGAVLGPVAMAASTFLPGPRAAALPMDLASRMARAETMGFRTGMPLYHGSANTFSAFDPARRGAMTGAAPARQGVALAVEPEVANEFAEIAGRATSNPTSTPQVYPLLHRADKPAVLTLSGEETNLEVAATLADAWERGHDAVMIRNFTTPGGQTGKNVLFVRNENQLRSPFAVFDPARKWDRDLLAGIAGLGAVPALGLMPVDHDPFALDYQPQDATTTAGARVIDAPPPQPQPQL
jgi:hypothetical protein